ncbi:MAG: adenylate kinase [Actinobacteria bacterium]|nr:adenylate kinase [Actinomycetota bacterium]
MRIVLMGPPGAGKGTQAAAISGSLGIPHISTGEIFRKNVGEGTELGKEAQKYMEKGEYVPDSVTNAMVKDRLAQPDAANGFLLDGYPRTAEQVQELNTMLAETGLKLDKCVEITADTDEVVQRLLKRAELEGRPDDTEEVIRRRMEVYAEQTAPLTAMYAEQGILVQVDGMGGVEEVTERLLAALR